MNRKTVARTSKKAGVKSIGLKLALKVMKIVFIIFLALGFAGAGIGGGLLYGYIKSAEPIPLNNLKVDKLTTIMYDSKGNERLHLSKDENRLWVDFKNIPDDLVNAFVSIEDERFFTHSGIDPKGIFRVALDYINPTATQHRGASTITQQLIKLYTGKDDRSIRRKVQEWWYAVELERNYSKEEVLELYLNIIYLGEGASGVRTATRAYFGKEIENINLSEAAYLAAINQTPSRYSKDLEAATARQRVVLGKMKELGKIDEDQYQKAVDYELVFNKTETEKRITNYSYFEDEVIDNVIADLMKKFSWTKEGAQSKLFNGGLKIYMTQDPDVQSAMDEVFKDPKYFPKLDKYDELPQGAMVIIDPYTGGVQGMVGGRGEKKESRGLNRATQSPRQPGSSIKPIAVYGPAIQDGIITPATVIDDVPLHLPSGDKQYSPDNYDNKFWGLTTILTSVTSSRNIPAVKTWLMLGSKRSVDYLKSVGVTTLTKDDVYAAMSLGGLSRGITTMEMAGAYQPFVNRGMYIKPYTYTKVEDSNGKVILENKHEGKLVMTEQAAYITTYMLENVVRAGTGTRAALKENNIAVAGKTGTTNGNMDKWFVGYTPYFTGAVWYGYDLQKHMIDKGQALIIWHDVMKKVHSNLKLEPKEFKEPAGIVSREICLDSGELVGPYCNLDPRVLEGKPRTAVYKFIKGTEPTTQCSVHTPPVKICKDSNWLSNKYCPDESIIEKVFIIRPQPYFPANPEDKLPLDRIYELPEGEYCNVHGPITFGADGVNVDNNDKNVMSTFTGNNRD